MAYFAISLPIGFVSKNVLDFLSIVNYLLNCNIKNNEQQSTGITRRRYSLQSDYSKWKW